jgi:hypothetical protein
MGDAATTLTTLLFIPTPPHTITSAGFVSGEH